MNTMSYIKKVPSLQERASLEVALNLCQESSFMAAALRLERPTNGFFNREGNDPNFVDCSKKLLLENERSSASEFLGFSDRVINGEQVKKPSFTTDPKILLSLLKNYNKYSKPSNVEDEYSAANWFAAVDEQSQKLLEKFPQPLKFTVNVWIDRIALEYMSYCRRQEILFDVSRYFLMNFLTRGDWTEACRFDELKLAERLVKDARLTYLQRYRIACVYCMVDDIPRLWKKLTENEKVYIFENRKSVTTPEVERLIQIWSLERIENHDSEVIQTNKIPWSEVLRQLVVYGSVSLLMPFWKSLKENVQQNMVIDLALISVEQWYIIQDDLFLNPHMKRLLSNEKISLIENYNLMSYYGELILFFLSEMNEDQQLLFFQRALLTKHNILTCFLHWPLCDYFLETINRLWEILPVEKYRSCLYILATLYSENYCTKLTFEYRNFNFYYDFLNGTISKSSVLVQMSEHYCKSQYKKINQHYDYRSLLWKLWEETPQEYKLHLFYDPMYTEVSKTKGAESTFLILLLKKSPFQKNDERLFKLIFSDLPETDRRSMMCKRDGQEISFILLGKGKYSFVTWLLQQCVEEEEIPCYKKQFITSESGRKLCFYKLQENHKKSLLNLLDWSFDLESEKTQFKHELLYGESCLTECKLLLRRGEFAEVERITNFCLTSNELKEEFKFLCVKESCKTLLKHRKLELLEKAFTWCLITENRINELKKILFTDVGRSTHFRLLYLKRWDDVRRFYKCFNLSLEEIKNLKRFAVQKFVGFIKKALYTDINNMNFYVEPLRWCLTDEEVVINFKNDVAEEYTKIITIVNARYETWWDDLEIVTSLNVRTKKIIAAKRLSALVDELFSGLGKDVQVETYSSVSSMNCKAMTPCSQKENTNN